MSRIQRNINSASGQRSVRTLRRQSRPGRFTTRGQESSSDEFTVLPDDSSLDWPPTTYTSEEPETKSISSTNEPSPPPGSWRSILTIPLVIVVVGYVLGRIVEGAAAFATMILLVSLGGAGAGLLSYLLWRFINRMVRSSQKT